MKAERHDEGRPEAQRYMIFYAAYTDHKSRGSSRRDKRCCYGSVVDAVAAAGRNADWRPQYVVNMGTHRVEHWFQ